MNAGVVELSPRVRLYATGSQSLPLDAGWLCLPQLRNDEHVFGDGSHPTTRLCAGVLDLLCRQRMPQAVLDVGTGTGVLARIARARGARFVVGTDIDAVALASARAHAALDAHDVAIHFGAEPPDHWGPRFDLVVANILQEPLTLLAPTIARALGSGGDLIVSGFTRPQVPALRVCYEREGFTFVTEAHLDEWVLLRFEKG